MYDYRYAHCARDRDRRTCEKRGRAREKKRGFVYIQRKEGGERINFERIGERDFPHIAFRVSGESDRIATRSRDPTFHAAAARFE